MSAFVMDPTDIDAMLAWAASRNPSLTAGDLTALGEMLMAENVRSVLTRYPQDTVDTMPGPSDVTRVLAYVFQPVALPEPSRVVDLCGSWQYQSCETEDHATTPAWGVVAAIREEALRAANAETLAAPRPMLSRLPSDTRDIRHKALRQALKIAFPACRFSVKGSRGTGYGWSTVSWTDGPTEAAVDGIVSGFFGSQFNGMTDGYDSTHCAYTFEGVTYQAGGSGYHTTRHLSPAFARKLLAAVVQYWGGVERIPEVVVKDGWGDWTLCFEGGWDANYEPVRPDLDRNYHCWRSCIHRAAEDRQTVQS